MMGFHPVSVATRLLLKTEQHPSDHFDFSSIAIIFSGFFHSSDFEYFLLGSFKTSFADSYGIVLFGLSGGK
ncbi:hypothetical protein [Brenneria roseae]|uniref:hypothetical protein n=1 Tax=Brenneria roseae TaxID=1509241 RepID=UPI00109D8B53|nr:hypothetical protein [Brenneria roseae]